MGGTIWGDGFRAEWAPLGPTEAKQFAPHTHEVTLWHNGDPVAWDVATFDRCEEVAEAMHQTAI